MKNSIELAWAAGFFDGEGNARWKNFPYKDNPNASGTFYLQMKQTDLCLHERIQKAVGGGRLTGPYKPKNPKWSPTWAYAAAGEDARQIFKRLKPYLSPVKLEQANEALALSYKHLGIPVDNETN